MSILADVIVFPSAGEVELRQVEVPAPAADEIAVRTLYSMVSTGTELRVWAGHYGAAENFPLVPGYSIVGEVIAVGEDVKQWRVGDLLSSGNPLPKPGLTAQWGAQASHHTYKAVGPLRLPEGASPLDYITVEIGAIPLRGATMAKPQVGETAVVIGQGLIGALAASWFTMLGARVIVCDVAPNRGKRALERGAAAFVNVREGDAAARVRSLCPNGAEIVVEASGSVAGIELALDLLRPTGGWSDATPKEGWPRLVLQANYLDNISLNLFSCFEGEGLTLLAPMDRRLTDRQGVLSHIQSGRFRSGDFVDRVVSWREAKEAYTSLRDNPNEYFSLIFDWTK